MTGLSTPPPLIRPDRFAKAITGVSLIGFILLVSFQIHYASIDHLNKAFTQYTTPGKQTGTLIGTPKKIRSDEWFIATPTIISQFNKGFPIENPAIGAARSPLVMNIPVNHFSAIFMPQHYGFFLLPLDYAFSFLWNYRLIGLFLSTFLVLLLLTGNHTWLSLTGSLLLLFSPYVQWFFSTFLGEYIIAANLIVLSLVGLVFSVRIFNIILNSLIFILFSLNLFLIPYPPFQVPLFYLIVTLFAGFLISRYDPVRISSHLLVKSIAAATAFIIVAWVAVMFLRDIKETMDLVLNTSYPGRRFSTGGTLHPLGLFSGYFDIFLYEKRFLWSNICETSTFILLFPFMIPVIFFGLIKKRTDTLQVLLLIFLILLSLFMVIGVNPFLAKISLMKMVPAKRAFFTLGIANIYLMIIFLSDPRKYFPETRSWKAILLIMILLIVSAISLLFNRYTNHFFKPWEVAAATIVISMAIWLLLHKMVIPFTLLMLAMVIQTTYDVFPVSSGTQAITGKKMYHFARDIHRMDPEARWVTFDNTAPSALLTAAGVDLFNGTKYTPDFEALFKLDPEKRFFQVYNRYAHIIVQRTDDTTHLAIQKTIPAHYTIEVSPQHADFRKLGIRYLIFPADSASDRYAATQQAFMKKLNDEPIDGYNFFQIKEPSCP